jgi:nitrite reductase (NO-forming)
MPADRILPVTQQAPDEGACCGACATQQAMPVAQVLAAAQQPPAGPTPARPVIPLTARHNRPPISRSEDRQITFGGVATAAALLGIAVASIALPEAARRGLWLPLHLGLAGAAGTAIAAVLPFFTAALAVAPPARAAIRISAIAFVAVGALIVSGGVALDAAPVAVAGGLVYITGLAAIALAAFTPLRGSLGPRRRLVETAYGAALLQVVAGAATATALLAGFVPVAERWALLKPAHAWLNVFGFLSVVVAATLLHLAPTVAGTRIRPRASAVVAVVGLSAGAPVVALGLALASDPLARLGAAIEIVGAASLVVHALAVWRARGAWTTNPAWHRVTGWSLTIAPVWFLVAVAIAAGRVLDAGASPASWSLGLLAAPLAIGWVAQVIVGSWSHVLPAIGPGDMPVHARQREILGLGALPRILALNGGVALVTFGGLVDARALITAGVVLIVSTLAVALALFVLAARGRVVVGSSLAVAVPGTVQR